MRRMRWWSVFISPLSTGWRQQALQVSSLPTLRALVKPTQWVGAAQLRTGLPHMTWGLRRSHLTRTHRPKVRPKAQKSSHSITSSAARLTGAGVDALGLAWQRASGGTRSPRFPLRSACNFCAGKQSSSLGLTEASVGCAEGLVLPCLSRQAALQPPGAAKLLVSPAHASACSLASAPASASSAPSTVLKAHSGSSDSFATVTRSG